MKVNLKKTQAIVFRNGGKTSKSENIFLLGQESKGSRILSLFGADFFFKK